jgi:hypothetical protein
VKEFEHDPRVVTAVVSQEDSAAALDTFWRNIYLRGRMLYDPTGNVGRTLYQQPAGGIPFSRGFIIDQEMNVHLAIFGHHPQRVISEIHALLGDPDCARESATCLHLDPGGAEPELALEPGACAAAAASGPYEVVRGRLGEIQLLDDRVDLGLPSCVAADHEWDRVTDVSADPHPACDEVPALYYLARKPADPDYGSDSAGRPRETAAPACP